MNRFNLSYWDTMIIAACLEVNVQTFYTIVGTQTLMDWKLLIRLMLLRTIAGQYFIPLICTSITYLIENIINSPNPAPNGESGL